MSAEEERDKFEHYLFEMDDVLEDFVGEAQAVGYALDYREDSLGALEAFIAERLESDPSQVKNRAARYLGEVFRKNVGGHWDIYLENPKDLHYKLPVVTGFSSADLDFCPIELVENFVVKKEAGTLIRAFKYHKQCADKT
ncbi:MAG: hypothetical protein ABI779_03865 [Acidobacteriota bacterium]